jgi:hypothetical protein
LAKDRDKLADSFDTENTGGLLGGILAEEDEFDRRALWRLASWGVGAVGAVIVAAMANQWSLGWRHDQIAASDLMRQAQQIQAVARESQNETRRLAAAIDTLNGDRDRLYSRVTTLEQGLDPATGAIARQNPPAPSPAAAPAASLTSDTPSAPQSPAPAVASVATTQSAPATAEKPPAAAAAETGPTTVSSVGKGASNTPPVTPATALMASKSIMDPPDPAAGKLIEPGKAASAVTAAPIPEVVASTQGGSEPEADETPSPKAAIQRTEFGVDLGRANSVSGLRALWRGLLKSRSNAPLAALRPIIVVKESNSGLGMQLRLVAGPVNDAGAAAKICAVLTENERSCETTVFDGQRLSLQADDQPPVASKPASRRQAVAKRTAVEEPPKKPEGSTISSWFNRKNGQ